MVKSKDGHITASKESEPIDSDGNAMDQNTKVNNGPDIDPLDPMDTLIETTESKSMENDDDTENLSNAGNSSNVVLDLEPKLRLVPITSLLNQNVPTSSSIESNLDDSDSDDNQPLKQLIKPSFNKISLKTKNRHTSNESNGINNNASKPKSKKSNTNNINGHESNKSDIVVPAQFNVIVNVDPLPKRMENALKKFNLSEICDHKSRVVASSKV